MKYGMSSSASATAVRQASGSVRISSSGSLPAGIRITRTLFDDALELLDKAPLRRRLAREVDVVGQGHRIGVSIRELDLAGGQRRTEAGDHVLEAGLVSGHHVGVALHDDGQLLPRIALLARSIAYSVRLLSNRAVAGEFRYFGPSASGMIRPPRPTGPPAVSDGDDDPATEPIDSPAAARRTGDARIGELTVAEALRSQPAGQRFPTCSACSRSPKRSSVSPLEASRSSR